MKEGWTYKKLGEIATGMYRGSGIKRDQVTKEGMPCVRYGEIYTTYNVAFDSCVSHTKEEYISSPKYFEYGDLLFAITGESVEDIGKTIAYLGNEKCLCGGDIVCMKHKQNPKYLSYVLSTPDAIRQKGIGKTKLKVVHTNIPSLSEIRIPIPPLSEQQSIVDYLDSAFAKIDAMKANAEKALGEAKTLFQASLKEMLEPKEGWNSMKLGDFAYMKAGDFVKASDIYQDYTEGLYPCYGGNGLRGYVREPNQEGDFCLIGRQGALCGCVNRAKGVFRTTEHAVIVKPYQVIPTSLVYYMLTNLNLNKYATGAAQPGLSVKNIAEQVIIPVPPQAVQLSIATSLDSLKSKVDRLQANFDKISKECDALKQAILRQVFE